MTPRLDTMLDLCRRATKGKWTAFFAFGSSDLPCSIEVEDGTEIVAGIECPKRIKICDVAEDSENPTHNFRFISSCDPQTIEAMIGLLKDGFEWIKKNHEMPGYSELISRFDEFNKEVAG